MLNFSKTHKVEFFCNTEIAKGIPEPYLNSQHFPQWYANTPNPKKCPLQFLHNNLVNKNTNVKGCPGITDFLKSGYTIPAWTNFVFRNLDNTLYVNWERGNLSKYGLHGHCEYEGMLQNQQPLYGGFHKLDTPWSIRTSPGISCLFVHSFWNRDNRFTNVSAIHHTDIGGHSPIKWFFEWNCELEPNVEVQIIKKGDPLIYIFPFKREKFKSKITYLSKINHDSGYQEYSQNVHDWFGNTSYNKLRKTIGKLFF